MRPAAPIKLSRREEEVARLVVDGLTNREIAERLFISERTAEYHVEQIRNKLGFHSRAQIAAWVAEQRASAISKGGQTARTNLPVQLTSFVGREAELSELRRLLEQSRLVTLTGPGGVGKTRLALEVAGITAGKYDQGVWLVELAGLSDEALVVQAVASAVGMPETPGPPLLDSLIERMAGWDALIVLDNCEHLIGAAAAISEQLLKRCSHLRILTTSREALKVSSEVIWQVPSLALPADEGNVSLNTAANSEAMRLFLERGQHADPRFNLTATDVGPVAGICRHLDGMPLAIELAAARLATMSPEGILENLDRRFQILTGGSRNAMPRHRTLEATFDWSYALLAEEERILFDRLAIFKGSFTVEAAEAICPGEALAHSNILPLLLRLCERSLVSTQPIGGGQTRYRMLETLRQYGIEHLEALEREALQRRHAAYFDGLAAEALRGSLTPERVSWLQRLQDDVDNLRASFDWALIAEPAVALRMASNLGFFWRARINPTEALDRTISALERMPERTLLRAQCLNTAANFARFAGRYAECRRLNREGLEIARAVAPPSDLHNMIARAGSILQDLEPEEADQLLREGLELWVPSADPKRDQLRLGITLTDLGWVSYVLHDLDAALDYSNRALQILDGGRASPYVHTAILDTLANVALAKGDLVTARIHFQAELEIAVELQDLGKVFLGLHGLGNVEAAESRPLRAQRLFGAAVTACVLSGRVVIPSQDDAHFAPWRRRARAALDSEAAELALVEGAQMTTDEAVAYALSDTQAMPTPSECGQLGMG